MKNLLIVLTLILGVSIFSSCSKEECETCAMIQMRKTPDYTAPWSWNGKNYLLKTMHDLDFLQECEPVLSWLGPKFNLTTLAAYVFTFVFGNAKLRCWSQTVLYTIKAVDIFIMRHGPLLLIRLLEFSWSTLYIYIYHDSV